MLASGVDEPDLVAGPDRAAVQLDSFRLVLLEVQPELAPLGQSVDLLPQFSCEGPVDPLDAVQQVVQVVSHGVVSSGCGWS